MLNRFHEFYTDTIVGDGFVLWRSFAKKNEKKN